MQIATKFGVYADNAFALGIGGEVPALLFLQGAAGNPLAGAAGAGGDIATSTDGGRTWGIVTSGSCAGAIPSGGINGVPVPVSATALRGYGILKDTVGSGETFHSSAATTFSVAPDGGLACEEMHVNVSFTGLPQPSHCASPGAFGCPFRLAGGSLATLSNGHLVYSAMVFWGAPDAKGIVASSIVAFVSTDGGVAWRYSGTIADTSAYPASQEGPNENSLVALSDGATLACVFRLDAGDGPATHPFVPYTVSLSHDGGATWTRGVTMPTAGSARPKLLHLGADGAGGFPSPAAPVLLTGGRFRDAALNTSGWDAKVWVNGDSAALAPDSWSLPASISFWHNTLTPDASWRFTPAVNDSTAPRQCTAYTSIVPLDGGATPGARSRRVGLTYNRQLAGTDEMFFMMPLVVEW